MHIKMNDIEKTYFSMNKDFQKKHRQAKQKQHQMSKDYRELKKKNDKLFNKY